MKKSLSLQNIFILKLCRKNVHNIEIAIAVYFLKVKFSHSTQILGYQSRISCKMPLFAAWNDLLEIYRRVNLVLRQVVSCYF